MNAQASLDPWLVDHLVCPRDRGPLQVDARQLICAQGHRYPVVDGIPVMLVPEATATIDILHASLAAAEASGDPLHLATLSLTGEERRGIAELASTKPAIDPVVAYLIAATNGLMYRHLIGTLTTYPIPRLPLPEGNGRRLLDVGCSWGRWTLAASAGGYDAVGIDPSLGAVLAARRVAAALRRSIHYVVGDARHLPFADAAFDVTYSYSVLQHFSFHDAAAAAAEMGRVLAPGGQSKVQMPIRYGVRCLYHQLRRGFRDAQQFEVRYWDRSQLRRVFERAIGPTRFAIDGYFGIGLQSSDEGLMPPSLAAVLRVSDVLKRVSRVFPPVGLIADSVFVESARATRPQ